jgi:hypothetical protein
MCTENSCGLQQQSSKQCDRHDPVALDLLWSRVGRGQHRDMQPTFSATGSSSSMKGTTRNTVSGTSRKMSALVRVSCRCSRLHVTHNHAAKHLLHLLSDA